MDLSFIAFHAILFMLFKILKDDAVFPRCKRYEVVYL